MTEESKKTPQEEPEGSVPCNDLRDLMDSWRWMQRDTTNIRDSEERAFIDGYNMALDHAIADLRRQTSKNE